MKNKTILFTLLSLIVGLFANQAIKARHGRAVGAGVLGFGTGLLVGSSIQRDRQYGDDYGNFRSCERENRKLGTKNYKLYSRNEDLEERVERCK